MKPNVIIINIQDNVAVALEDIPRGSAVILPGGDEFLAQDTVPYSHKVAIVDIERGTVVRKYGESIGKARENIGRGAWVHTHNMDIEGSGQ
jgi:hypothetical protein